MVHHRHAQDPLGPRHGVGVGPLAGEEQGAEAREVVALHQAGLRILLLHRPQRRRRGEQRHRPGLGDHAPERPGIGRADRLALVQHRGAAVQQRPVDDVGMAHHPADVGGAPVGLAGGDAVEVRHRPGQRHEVAAGVAHHALGLAGGARGVEHVERIGGGDRHARRGAARGPGLRHGLGPIPVARLDHLGDGLRPLQDQAGIGFVRGEPAGLVEERLVGDDPGRLDAAGGGEHHLGGGVLDAGGELAGGEPPEHHRVHRADAGAGQHREQRFGHHRHVEHHPVAAPDAEILQHGGERRDLVEKLRVGDPALRPGDGGIVQDRRLLAAAGRDVAVDRVVAGIDLGAHEPAAVGSFPGGEDPGGGRHPVDRLRGVAPERLRVALPGGIGLRVAARAGHGVVLRCRPSRGGRAPGIEQRPRPPEVELS